MKSPPLQHARGAAATPKQPACALSAVLSPELWEGRAVLSVREVAGALHVTEQHVVNLITEGRLKAVNVGNGPGKNPRASWRIPVSAWDAYIRENAS